MKKFMMEDAREDQNRSVMRGSVLIVDDDRDISSLVAEVLTDEGFAVVELADLQSDAIQHEVTRVEPDVVLLDGWDATGYGQSWLDAAWLHARARPIAVIMFTSHTAELQEAQLGESERSQAAAFVGLVAKPFDLQELIDIVVRAVEEPATVLSLR
jgi:DNA-binding NtrC family response regulator